MFWNILREVYGYTEEGEEKWVQSLLDGIKCVMEGDQMVLDEKLAEKTS